MSKKNPDEEYDSRQQEIKTISLKTITSLYAAHYLNENAKFAVANEHRLNCDLDEGEIYLTYIHTKTNDFGWDIRLMGNEKYDVYTRTKTAQFYGTYKTLTDAAEAAQQTIRQGNDNECT